MEQRHQDLRQRCCASGRAGSRKAAYPLVFIAPNNVICLFAGAAGMSVAGVLRRSTSPGTIARLYLIRRLGEAFERPIDDVLDFIARYRAPLLVVSITFFTVVMVRELRAGQARTSRTLEERRSTRTPASAATS